MSRDFYKPSPPHPEFSSEPIANGDGDPNCTSCRGRGVVTVQDDGKSPPVVQRCKCVRMKDIALRMHQGWRNLHTPSVTRLPGTSALIKRVNQNTLITANMGTFRSHVRDIALRCMLENSMWSFDVVTDAQLITSWLAQIKIDNGEILDGEIRMLLPEYADLESAVLPPDLLIVHLGVKKAANKETSNVLYEALQMRDALGKPTWLWDQPHSPLAQGHLAWSHALWDLLFGVLDFQRVRLSDGGEKVSAAGNPTRPPAPIATPQPSYSASSTPPSSMSAEALLAESEPKKKWRK